MEMQEEPVEEHHATECLATTIQIFDTALSIYEKDGDEKVIAEVIRLKNKALATIKKDVSRKKGKGKGKSNDQTGQEGMSSSPPEDVAMEQSEVSKEENASPAFDVYLRWLGSEKETTRGGSSSSKDKVLQHTRSITTLMHRLR